MKVWMVRHGESENNLKKLWTGWMDVPLTSTGEEQAARVAALMEGVNFDRVFSSDLMRAKRTAEIAVPGCRCEAMELLREVDLGTLAGKSISSISNEERQALACCEGYWKYGGESREKFNGRVKAAGKMLESLTDCENVAVFAHGGFLRAFLREVLEFPVEVTGRILCKNCATAIFEYTPESGWVLYSWINVT